VPSSHSDTDETQSEKNDRIYSTIFAEEFETNRESVSGLSMESTSMWDSLEHMYLIAALEEAFDVVFEPEDVIAFDSFKAGRDILRSYGIEI
jgi:acyl carrier protein